MNKKQKKVLLYTDLQMQFQKVGMEVIELLKNADNQDILLKNLTIPKIEKDKAIAEINTIRTAVNGFVNETKTLSGEISKYFTPANLNKKENTLTHEDHMNIFVLTDKIETLDTKNTAVGVATATAFTNLTRIMTPYIKTLPKGK